MFAVLRVLVSALIAAAVCVLVFKASALCGPYVGFIVCLGMFGFVAAHVFEAAAGRAKRGIDALEKKYNERR